MLIQKPEGQESSDRSMYLSRLRGLKSTTVLFRDDDDDDEDKDSAQYVDEEDDERKLPTMKTNGSSNINMIAAKNDLDTEVRKLQVRTDDIKK